MRDFRELKVWQKAHEVTLIVYRTTAGFPSQEKYGITGQLRRAAVSIAANIAEGAGRRSEREFARFLDIAMGSASELEYLLLLSHDLKVLDQEHYRNLDGLAVEIKRMLAGFLKKISGNG